MNSKTFFYKDCSLVQSKIGLTTIVLTKLLMSKYKTAGIMKREREKKKTSVCVCIYIYIRKLTKKENIEVNVNINIDENEI